jgi:hypothetical protein
LSIEYWVRFKSWSMENRKNKTVEDLVSWKREIYTDETSLLKKIFNLFSCPGSIPGILIIDLWPIYWLFSCFLYFALIILVVDRKQLFIIISKNHSHLISINFLIFIDVWMIFLRMFLHHSSFPDERLLLLCFTDLK